MSPPPHIILAGGGTCGHLFPGVALAEQLALDMPRARIVFAGGGDPDEQQFVARGGYEYVTVPCRPLPRRPWHVWRFARDNFAGYMAARWYLRGRPVSLVVGLGGYASAPMVRAAVAEGLPTVLLEQNILPGRATRWLAPSATLVCAAFAESRRWLKKNVRLQVTGCPLRSEFRHPHGRVRDGDPLVGSLRNRQLLVLGGTNGARPLNENLPRAVYKLGERCGGWQILHQTGSDHVAATRQLYEKLGQAATVVPFIDNMAKALDETALVVCRGGGSTLAELAQAGTPAVVVPFRHAADNHQRENADVFAASGACRTIDETDLDGRLDDRLVQVLSLLLSEGGIRRRMSVRMQSLARPHAAEEVSAAIQRIVQPSFRAIAA